VIKSVPAIHAGTLFLTKRKPTFLINSEIIQDCKKGLESGHAQLYKECAPYVYSMIKRYISDTELRKDLMQEVFAKVFVNIKSYQVEKGSFNNWIRKIAVNECLQNLRKARPLLIAEGLDENFYVADDTPLPTDLNRDDIEKILERMPQGYKVVFMLSVIDGFSHEEISKQLKITKETSRSQLTRGKKWIKRYLLNQYKSNLYG